MRVHDVREQGKRGLSKRPKLNDRENWELRGRKRKEPKNRNRHRHRHKR